MWEDPHYQREAGEGVIARIHGTTVAASPLLPQAPLLQLKEKTCAEVSPPSVQRHGNILTQCAACNILAEACELLLREARDVSIEQSRGSLLTLCAACDLLTEACELLRGEAREVSFEQSLWSPLMQRAACELLRGVCELLQWPACKLPPQYLRAQQAAIESICAGSEQNDGLSRFLSQFRQPMSIVLGTQNGALPAAAQFSERAE